MAKIERIIWSHWPKVMVKLTFSSIRVIQIGPFMNNTKDDPRERGSKTVKSCEKSKNNASDRKKKFREPFWLNVLQQDFDPDQTKLVYNF